MAALEPTRPGFDQIRPIRSFVDAEHNAAVVLRRLGFGDAYSTPIGTDGGVDVRGSLVVAQVKAEVLPVGRPVVQQLYGCAAAERKSAAFFALGGYQDGALAWATGLLDYALFRFDLSGDVEPVNSVAVQWLQHPPGSAPTPVTIDPDCPGAYGIATLIHDPQEVETLIPAQLTGSPCRVTNATVLATLGDASSVMSSLIPGEMLFIFDAHDLSDALRVFLIRTVRDQRMMIKVGKGLDATDIPLEIAPCWLFLVSDRPGSVIYPAQRSGTSKHSRDWAALGQSLPWLVSDSLNKTELW